MAGRLWCASLRIPISDLGHLLDTLLVGIAVFLGESKLVGVLAQPNDHGLLNRFATPELIVTRNRLPSLDCGGQFRRVVVVKLGQVIGIGLRLRKKEPRINAARSQPYSEVFDRYSRQMPTRFRKILVLNKVGTKSLSSDSVHEGGFSCRVSLGPVLSAVDLCSPAYLTDPHPQSAVQPGPQTIRRKAASNRGGPL